MFRNALQEYEAVHILTNEMDAGAHLAFSLFPFVQDAWGIVQPTLFRASLLHLVIPRKALIDTLKGVLQ